MGAELMRASKAVSHIKKLGVRLVTSENGRLRLWQSLYLGDLGQGLGDLIDAIRTRLRVIQAYRKWTWPKLMINSARGSLRGEYISLRT